MIYFGPSFNPVRSPVDLSFTLASHLTVLEAWRRSKGAQRKPRIWAIAKVYPFVAPFLGMACKLLRAICLVRLCACVLFTIKTLLPFIWMPRSIQSSWKRALSRAARCIRGETFKCRTKRFCGNHLATESCDAGHVGNIGRIVQQFKNIFT